MEYNTIASVGQSEEVIMDSSGAVPLLSA